MAENITKIKVGDDVRCISLDTEAIDTSTIGFGGDGKLGVRLGSSVYAAKDGIGVKIHPDTLNFLRREPSGLSLKLDTMVEGMAGAVGKKLGLAIDDYDNLIIGTEPSPLKLGTGLKGVDDGHTLCLNLGSGLGFNDKEGNAAPTVAVKLLVGQVLQFTSDGELSINYETLARILKSDYGFVCNK